MGQMSSPDLWKIKKVAHLNYVSAITYPQMRITTYNNKAISWIRNNSALLK
jgi:hypothetical protein